MNQATFKRVSKYMPPMKFVDGFEIVCINDKYMAVSTGDAADVYKGIISLNKTAYRIWKYIEEGLDCRGIARRLSGEYQDLSFDDAYIYVREFTDKLIDKGILAEG